MRKQMIQIAVVALFSSLFFGCSTFGGKSQQQISAEEMDRVLALPDIAAIAKNYDDKFGERAFRRGVVNTGQILWDRKGALLSPAQAVSTFISIDVNAYIASIPQAKAICDSKQIEPCPYVVRAEENLKTYRACTENDAQSCLKLAFLYESNGYDWIAADYAQKVCLENDQRGCDLYGQITNKEASDAQARAANRSQAQQNAIYQAQQRQQANQQIIGGLQMMSQTLNQPKTQPASVSPVHCTSSSAQNISGQPVINTDCQ